MRCRECEACKKGYFKSRPDTYVCTGVKHPFVIEDIDVECTEYQEYKNREVSKINHKTISKEEYCIGECLYVGVDISPQEEARLVVMRREGTDTYVINQFRNDEALDIYNKLIGNKNDFKAHGHWVLLDNCSNHGVYCSVCNKKVYKDWYGNVKLTSKYCPNCGAIMDEEFKRL